MDREQHRNSCNVVRAEGFVGLFLALIRSPNRFTVVSQTRDSVGSGEVTRAGKTWDSAGLWWFCYLQPPSLRLPVLGTPYSLLNLPNFVFPSLFLHIGS